MAVLIGQTGQASGLPHAARRRDLGIVIDTVVEIPIPGRWIPPEDGRASGPEDKRTDGDFLAGPENRLVRAAMESLLGGVRGVYNPLTLVGPPGSGKSHLAAGLVAVWRARFGPRSAVYVPAMDFARQWTDATETHATADFQNRYRRVKLLAVDDADLLASKAAAQQELVYTLDALTLDNGQVVLTYSAPPQTAQGLMPRLQSRILAGLVVPLAFPAPSTRLIALRRFASLRQLDLPEEAATWLADGLSGPLSEVWGAVLALELSARMDGGAITLGRVRQWLADRHAHDTPALRDIAAATARQFSLKVGDLRSASRRRAVVLARDVAMYLARLLTGNSYEQIGKYFNGRDHSTVSHGCSKTANLLENDPVLRTLVDRVRQEFQAT
jgi:chromosomal replication initiator protein